MLTLALSAAALFGYLAYRSLDRADVETPAEPVAVPTEVLAADADELAAARQPAETLPEFSLGNLAGEPQSIRSWPDKPLLINFWATWCAPCLREIPMLKELQSSRADLQVVGIAIDRRDPVVAFAADMQFNYPILIGQSEAWQAAAALGVEIYALPFTVFAAGDGTILGVHTGELHAEHLETFSSVIDELQAQRIGVAEARSRIAGRM